MAVDKTPLSSARIPGYGCWAAATSRLQTGFRAWAEVKHRAVFAPPSDEPGIPRAPHSGTFPRRTSLDLPGSSVSTNPPPGLEKFLNAPMPGRGRRVVPPTHAGLNHTPLRTHSVRVTRAPGSPRPSRPAAQGPRRARWSADGPFSCGPAPSNPLPRLTRRWVFPERPPPLRADLSR